MRIAVLGTGSFGSYFGAGLIAAGYDVVHGARNLQSDSVAKLLERWPGTPVVPLTEAIQAGDVIIVATAPDSLQDIAAAGDHERHAFAGKVVIDTSNAIDWSLRPPRMSATRAQAAVLQELLPDAKVVKAFNTLRSTHMSNAEFAQGRAISFVCGDDEDARRLVAGIAEDLGFEPVDAGPLSIAFEVEQAAALWIGISARDGFGRNTALSLTRRAERTGASN